MKLGVTAILGCSLFALGSAQAWATPPSCPGQPPLPIFYHERLESQGFLGLATPRASAEVVREALELRFTWAESERPLPGEPGFPEAWSLVCAKARRQNAAQLWIACRGDTDEVESRFLGTLGQNSPDWLGTVETECLIAAATNPLRNPDFAAIKRLAITRSMKGHDVLYHGMNPYDGDRHRALGDRNLRLREYSNNLMHSVIETAIDFRREAAPTPKLKVSAGEGSCPERPESAFPSARARELGSNAAPPVGDTLGPEGIPQGRR